LAQGRPPLRIRARGSPKDASAPQGPPRGGCVRVGGPLRGLLGHRHRTGSWILRQATERALRVLALALVARTVATATTLVARFLHRPSRRHWIGGRPRGARPAASPSRRAAPSDPDRRTHRGLATAPHAGRATLVARLASHGRRSPAGWSARHHRPSRPLGDGLTRSGPAPTLHPNGQMVGTFSMRWRRASAHRAALCGRPMTPDAPR